MRGLGIVTGKGRIVLLEGVDPTAIEHVESAVQMRGANRNEL